jgi:glycosyltransferase involved in cell wall biosynthesis
LNPTVSVILPVWNGERFLAAAIDSILRQTFASLELLVIDDGSTDSSRFIAMEKARTDQRVIVLDTPHRGIAHALNTGIHAARAPFVARMDADDISDPSRLEKQIAFMEAHPECVAAGADVDVIDADDETIGFISFPPDHSGIVQALVTGDMPSLAHPTILMRKEAVLAAGAYREADVPSEDLDLWLRLIEFGEMANLSEPLLRYRMHRGATSIRDGSRQRMTTAVIRAAARARRGLPPLKTTARYAYSHRDADATFHYECVRTALSSRNRAAVIKHARASIRRAPGWWRPYAALAVSVLSQRSFTLFMRAYSRLRNGRPAPISSIT